MEKELTEEQKDKKIDVTDEVFCKLLQLNNVSNINLNNDLICFNTTDDNTKYGTEKLKTINVCVLINLIKEYMKNNYLMCVWSGNGWEKDSGYVCDITHYMYGEVKQFLGTTELEAVSGALMALENGSIDFDIDLTKQEKDIKELNNLAKKYDYLVVKNVAKDFCEKQSGDGFKIISYHTIEDINNILEGEPLYVEYDFSNEKRTFLEFDNGKALAYLLMCEKVFINDYRRVIDKKTQEEFVVTSILVNCNDVFAWACADAEEITSKELKELYYYVKKDMDYGSIVWCIKKRNMMPQKPVYDMIKRAGIWDLDSMELEKNNW